MIISRNENCLRVSQHLLVAIIRSWVAATCGDMLYIFNTIQLSNEAQSSEMLLETGKG